MSNGEGEDNVLTRKRLLKHAGEFDLESVHFIKLVGMKLEDISSLEGCKNITRLNVCNNKISSIRPLAQLKMITCLNITDNRITNIDCLSGMENLEELLAAGNLLSNIERLKCLTGISSLKKLRLHDGINKLTNPVCQVPKYQTLLLQLLPMLLVLDGNRVRGKGSELHKLCCELDQQIESFSHNEACPCDDCLSKGGAGRSFGPVAERAMAKSWIPPGYLEYGATAINTPVQQSKATQEFLAALKECALITEQVDTKLG